MDSFLIAMRKSEKVLFIHARLHSEASRAPTASPAVCRSYQGLPVIVPPGKALCDKLLGCEALHQLDDLEIGYSGDLRMFLQVEVLFRIQHALCSSMSPAVTIRATNAGLARKGGS